MATELVAQTMAGSAAMLLERMEETRKAGRRRRYRVGVDTSPAQLRATVTSRAAPPPLAFANFEAWGFAGGGGPRSSGETRSEQLGITSE